MAAFLGAWPSSVDAVLRLQVLEDHDPGGGQELPRAVGGDPAQLLLACRVGRRSW